MELTKYKRIRDNKVFTLEWLWKVKDKSIAAFIGEDNRETLMIEQVIGADGFVMVEGKQDVLVAFNPDNNQLSVCPN